MKAGRALAHPCAVPAVPHRRHREAAGRAGAPGAAAAAGGQCPGVGTRSRLRAQLCGPRGRPGHGGPGAATLKVARLGHSCSPARLRHKCRDARRAGCAGGRGHAATSETAARRGSCVGLPVRDRDSRYGSRAPQTASIKPRALLKGSHQTEQVRSRRFRLQSHVAFAVLTR